MDIYIGRDLGAMKDSRTGGQLGNFPANSFLSINGMPIAKMNEGGGYGSSETVEVKQNDPKQYVKREKVLFKQCMMKNRSFQ